jgi:hypothetical protein
MSGSAGGAAELGGRSVGIDLGTTNSAVAAVVDGSPKILANRAGHSTTPSVVAFAGDKILVGAEAVEQADSNPANTFSSVKRIIGRKLKEANKAVADPSLLKRIIESPDGQVALQCEALGRGLLPEEVSTHVIKRLLEDAEAALGEKVTRAVITVPAYFTDAQREATEAAGLLAGLEKVKLLREPEAAALAYGLEKLDDELILVFDLGPRARPACTPHKPRPPRALRRRAGGGGGCRALRRSRRRRGRDPGRVGPRGWRGNHRGECAADSARPSQRARQAERVTS